MRLPIDEEKFTCPSCGEVNSKKCVVKEKPGEQVELPGGAALPLLGLPLEVRAKCKKCQTVFVVEDRRILH